MHREFRQLLDSATGTSEYIVVVLVDVRGFTAFSTLVDSADTGLYIRKVYAAIIDSYFTEASFFKPTGDGLLLTIPFTEATLEKTVIAVVETSFALVEEFPTLLDGDPMITFEVPKGVGIGLARGSASRLRSEDKILDYSGRALNVASRLQNLARPSGIVSEHSFADGLLPETLAKRFDDDAVYLPGIAETAPVPIVYSSEFTEIDPRARQPIREYKWSTQKVVTTAGEIDRRPGRFWIRLPERPVDESLIKVVAEHSRATPGGRKAKGFHALTEVRFEYILDAGRPTVILMYSELTAALRGMGVRPSWAVTIDISYPTPP